MASRPIFIPMERRPFVGERSIEFEWHPGFALTQQRKSIASLHDSASKEGYSPTLEISSKSTEKVGVSLSAFHLQLELEGGSKASVEAWFQSSKVFNRCGPFPEFLGMSGREIKKDPRLRESGPLLAFRLQGQDWPLHPKTSFYDWLYLKALVQNPELSEKLNQYESFSDIAFNPKKSLNCQARSAALFVGLLRAGLLTEALENRDAFISTVYRPRFG